ADGPVTVSCSLDGAAFSTACAAARSFSTPTLAPGSHALRVRARNAAGARTTVLSWQVVALPAPAGCSSCFHPPHLDSAGNPMTWDWQLSVSGANLVYRDVDLLDVDGFDNPASVVAAIHARPGKTLVAEKAICYLSLGSWE